MTGQGETDALGDVGAGTVLGLAGGGAEVRGDDDLREVEQRRVGAGLGREDVESGSADLAGVDGVGQCLLVDQTTAGGVDDDDTLLGAGELLGADETEGLGRLGQVHGDEVGALEELVEADQLDAELSGPGRRNVGVVRDDVGLEGGQTCGDQLADAAEADDADGLVEDLDTVERRTLPGLLAQGGVGGRDLARRRHQQRDGVLGGGVDVGGRRVDDHDATGGGGGDVDVVETDTGACDDLQLLAGVEDLGVDSRRGTHEDGVGVDDGLEQLGTVRAVDPSHLDTVTECFHG